MPSTNNGRLQCRPATERTNCLCDIIAKQTTIVRSWDTTPRGDSGCSHGDMPCDYIATIKHQGHWYCELHYDALVAGETLHLIPDVMEANRRF
jgi:hypothetical protein